jgi:hypothetical protein
VCDDIARIHGTVVVTVACLVFWHSLLRGLLTRTKFQFKARYARTGQALALA